MPEPRDWPISLPSLIMGRMLTAAHPLSQNIDYVMHVKRRQAGKTPTRGMSSASLADKPKEALASLADHVCTTPCCSCSSRIGCRGGAEIKIAPALDIHVHTIDACRCRQLGEGDFPGKAMACPCAQGDS
jgi:hypothetical protein